MAPVAFSVFDVLLVLGLGAAGFLVVALVCAAVLAVLQVVLPSADTGAVEVDRVNPPQEKKEGDVIPAGEAGDLDS